MRTNGLAHLPSDAGKIPGQNRTVAGTAPVSPPSEARLDCSLCRTFPDLCISYSCVASAIFKRVISSRVIAGDNLSEIASSCRLKSVKAFPSRAKSATSLRYSMLSAI